ncbi:hypothetical protein AGMMS49991_10090 [Spirochaetia bacterium]|nr:hypothetical protein AGMMS49991_10090 [Spirochaetia bacterium]
MVFYSATILAAAVLIFRPLKFRIYIGVFFTWALIHFIEKRSVIGIVDYALAGMFAYRVGFFKTWLRVKMGVFLGIVLAALVVEVGARFLFTGTIVLWGLEFFSTVGLGIALFLAEFIQKPRVPALTDGKKSVGMLSSRGISSGDLDILRRILKKEKYESIAASCEESLSTFKRRIHQLFVKIGAVDHDDFCRLYSDDDNPELPAAESLSVQ